MITRRGNDWTTRFPLIVKAVNHLKVRSCLIDGEAVCCDERGLAIFSKLRRRQEEGRAFLYAFDLLGLDGTDLRREPIEVRQRRSPASCAKAGQACGSMSIWRTIPDPWCSSTPARWGFEGIVSKRKGSPYRSGRSKDWLKMKNPACEAVKREAEEDWGR